MGSDNRTQQVLEHVQGNREAMVDVLQRFARAESPSTEPQSLTTVANELTQELEATGYCVRRLPGKQHGGSLFASPRLRVKNRSRQLLLGHCDTVWPLGTLQNMPIRDDDGALTGPGVLDMKSGLVQIIFALRCLSDLNVKCPVTPLVFVNSDEEIGSPESTTWVRRLAKICTRVFVLEPGFGLEGRLKTARKGVGRFTIRIEGKAAHAGINPEEGASAVLELSHQIQQLFALNDPAHGVTVNVGTVDAGLRPNVVAPAATATVDVRVPTAELAAQVESSIRDLRPVHPQTRVTVTGAFGRAPMEPTPANQKLWLLAKRLGRDLGIDLEQAHVGGASDANTTSRHTATLDGLGGVGAGAHAPNEHVIVSKMVERTALLALLIAAPAQLDIAFK